MRAAPIFAASAAVLLEDPVSPHHRVPLPPGAEAESLAGPDQGERDMIRIVLTKLAEFTRLCTNLPTPHLGTAAQTTNYWGGP